VLLCGYVWKELPEGYTFLLRKNEALLNIN
jgi:hypothetical protein